MTKTINLPLSAVNTFEEQVINTHTTTLIRLLEIDTNAFTLYMFYVVTAKRQALALKKHINPIKAGRDYCKKGLGWGNERYHKAKNILLEHNFIEDYTDIDDNTKSVQGHYIFLHYLQNSYNAPSSSYKPHVPSKTHGPQNPPVGSKTGGEAKTHMSQNPPVGSRTPNTVEHSRNTVEYNNNISPIPHSKHTFSSSEQSDYRSQKAHSKLIALTEPEIEELALKLNVSPSLVLDKHEQVWESIENQDKYGKKVKNVKQTVRNWVKWAIDNNRVEQLSPEARLALIYTSPMRDIEFYKRLDEVERKEKEDGGK